MAAATASAATPPKPIQPIPVNPGGPNVPAASATLSSAKAGAKPVALTVTVHYEMVCGQPGPGTAVLTLPHAAFVPGTVPAAAVMVNGKPAEAVHVSGHDLSVTLPRHRGVTCYVMGPGTLRITLTKAAGIGNPSARGRYPIHVHRKALAFTANVDISA